MNYYERHLGDYAKDTSHLTMIEHGAYCLLLDRYYGTEAGIPADQVHRIARARTREERAAVDVVLAEFFELTDGVWINKRAEEEIAKAASKIKAAKENGRKGGRPRRVDFGSGNETQEKPSGLLLGSETETQVKAHQTPDTRHQTPDTIEDTHRSTAPTRAAAVCVALRAEGIQDVNPSNPDLVALLGDGAEIDDFVHAGRVAAQSGKRFPYVLGVVRGRRADAKRMAEMARARPMSGDKHGRHSVEEPA